MHISEVIKWTLTAETLEYYVLKHAHNMKNFLTQLLDHDADYMSYNYYICNTLPMLISWTTPSTFAHLCHSYIGVYAAVSQVSSPTSHSTFAHLCHSHIGVYAAVSQVSAKSYRNFHSRIISNTVSLTGVR